MAPISGIPYLQYLGLDGGYEGIDASEWNKPPYLVCTIPLNISYKYPISPCDVQCVTGRCGYL